MHRLTAYLTAAVMFCLSLTPAVAGAATLARKKPKCATGKHAVRRTKRVRVSVIVTNKRGLKQRKRVWVKRRSWVCAKNAIKPIPAPDPPKPLVTPAPIAAVTPKVLDTTPPVAPPNFVATPGDRQVVLTWGASSDNVKTFFYEVFRDGVPIVTVDARNPLTFTDTSLTNGTTYVYTVVAHDSSDNVSDVSRVTATPVDNGAPSVPGGLAAVGGNAQVSLSWTAATDNVAVTGYNVYRSTGAGPYTLITSSPIQTLYLADAAVTNGTAYSYKVAAVDGANNISAQSAPATATPALPNGSDTTKPSTPTNIVATPGTGQASLSWTASTDNVGVTGYNVYRSTSAAGPFTAPLSTHPAGPSFTDVGPLTNGTTYYYKVTAVDAQGNESLFPASPVSVTPGDTTPPSTPNGVTVTKNNSAHTITVAWTASTDNIGVVKYRVVRNSVLAGQPTATSYVDKDLSAGATYSYTVAAVDAAGNISAPSPVVSTYVS